MKKFTPTIMLLTLTVVTSSVTAKQLWNDNSFTLLKGSDYTVPYTVLDKPPTDDETRTVFTYEHVSGQSWGDVFLFVDRLESSDNNNETYAEFSPRLSLGKTTGTNFEFGVVTDVLIGGTAEFVSTPGGLDQTHFLLGPAVDLKLPGFSYFQLNLFYRDNDSGKDSGWQLTPVWAVPFKLGALDFLYDGFADWRASTDDSAAETNLTSQLKWDVGALWESPKMLYVGIEYVYWRNKFGIKDGSAPFETNENNANILVKMHF